MAVARRVSALLLLTLGLACLPAASLAAEPQSKQRQEIKFTSAAPTNATVGGPAYTVSAAGGGSRNPVTLSIPSSSSSVCSISRSESPASVSFTGVGACTIDADQAGNPEYEPAPEKQQPITVKRGQNVTIESTPPNPTIAGETYTVSAKASSGQPVTLTASPGNVCTVKEVTTVELVGSGECTVVAKQAGDSQYWPAESAPQPFQVGTKKQTVTIESTPPSPALVGGRYEVKAKASSGLSATISSSPSSVCVTSGSTVELRRAGECTVTASQAGNNEYAPAPEQHQVFQVSKKPQTITFTSAAPSNATVGGPTYTVTATGGASGNPAVLTIDPTSKSICALSGNTSGSTVSFVGAGTCTIDANQAGDENYEPAPQVQQVVTVGKGSQAITFTSAPPSSATAGGPSYTPAATASSGLSVTFTIDPSSNSVCTISGATVSFIGTGICTIDANQAGSENYVAAPQVQQSFAVAAIQISSAFSTSKPPSGTAVVSSTQKGTFRAVSAMLHQPSDVITLNESLDEAGTLTWVVTFPNGPFGAFAARTKCRAAGLIRLKGRCVPAKVIFGEGQQTYTASGVVAITIKPSRAAKRAFERAKRTHRDIKLTATLTFLPLGGGNPVVHTQVLTIRLAKAK